MFQVKILLEGTFSLRDLNPQISETDATIKTLNKLTEIGMINIKTII
ncbi:Mobile element protein [Candidatus Enterovibrio altilux]|uniref:Mobile element protein n=1 Tax=Candidatus Enterovibrio altilux TaxID=1927128 RepID=A0A291B789_9GAMM|nr:Mobile element protein [Candidatus Enterovibrio luxaltus]